MNAPPDPADARSALAAGYIQPMCPVIPGKHHCLGYSLTIAGLTGYARLRNAQANTRSYGARSLRRTCSSNCLPMQSTQPLGYGPNDLQAAYGVTNPSNGAGRVIALIESGDAPTLEADLATYRAQFDLPPCTAANGCLRKVGQNGSNALPSHDAGWQGETQLDADVASALCPSCKLLVVEADDSGLGLDEAVNTAVRLGAFAVSNSWGGNENASEAPFFDHPGIPITAAAGDKGYSGSPQTPADLSTVIAVGGTTLTRSGLPRGWNEAAWTGGGSGCSAIIAKPTWQKDPGCPMRTVADVAFVADPATGVAIYDSNAGDIGGGPIGWRVVGGTSVGAPAVAALYALAGSSRSDASSLYKNASELNDVTSGANGTCATAYICTAETGYDAPTGNGTPNGISAF